ncbi:MAG TPA: hypothetical protein VD995_10975 [Azospirillum sp.]|nr:hypothetical protein [Azospirillum sp.]
MVPTSDKPLIDISHAAWPTLREIEAVAWAMEALILNGLDEPDDVDVRDRMHWMAGIIRKKAADLMGVE